MVSEVIRLLAYRTDLGECHNGDSLELMTQLDAGSVDLVVTSPPFALQRKRNMVMSLRMTMSHGSCSLRKASSVS